MKKLNKILMLTVLLASFATYAQVKIGDNPTVLDPGGSTLLEMESTTKGLLMPRMTTAQRTAIATPANGLQVFDTDTKSFWYFDATILPAPGAWVEKTSAKNAKWIDGTTAGDIVLNNPTGVDNVKYSDKKFSLIDKTLTDYPSLGTYPAYNTFLIAENNSHNFNAIKTSNTTKTDNVNESIISNHYWTFLDGADTRVNKLTQGIETLTQVNADNSNNHSVVSAVSNKALHYGTGKVNALYGQLIYARVGYGNSRADNVIGVNSQVEQRSDQPLGNLIAFGGYTSIQNSTGAISRIDMFKSNLTLGVSSANIANMSSFTAIPIVSSTYTGTITNAYDFLADNFTVTGVGASVTNKYGFYINGLDKLNYLQGTLGIGTTNRTGDIHIARGNMSNVPTGSIVLSRLWTDNTNTRASAIYHLNDGTADKLAIGVSGQGFSTDYASPLTASRIQMVIEDRGRVGIGTASPIGTLHTVGVNPVYNDRVSTAASNLILRRANGTMAAPTTILNGEAIGQITFTGYDGTSWATAGASINTFATEDWTTTAKGSEMRFSTVPNGGTSPANRMIITNNGLVGIATITPTQTLSLGGDAARTIHMERRSTDGSGQQLTVRAGGAFLAGTDRIGGNLVLSSGVSTGTGSSNIHFQTASASATGTADNTPATRMTISGAGYVGIGTTVPTAPLHINSNNNELGFFGNVNFVNQYITIRSEVTGVQLGMNTTLNPGGGAFLLKAGQNKDFAIKTNSNGTFDSVTTSDFYISNLTGNVGIGTNVPKTKLHVTGLPIYADNAAAKAALGGAGVAEGAFYHTGDGIVRVVF